MNPPRIHSFDAPEPLDVEIRTQAGDIRVTAEGAGSAHVELTSLGGHHTQEIIDDAEVSLRDGRLRVILPEERRGRGARVLVAVTVPSGSSLRARSAVADVAVRGRIDSLDVTTAAGGVTVADVDGEAQVTTASGDVSIDSVTGGAGVRTASGDISVRAAETVHAETASGDVAVRELGDSAEVRTASGDVTIDRAGRGSVEVTSVSGDVHVGVARGVLAHLNLGSMSGSIRTDLEAEDADPTDGEATLEIRAKTLSGDIRIARATVSDRS